MLETRSLLAVNFVLTYAGNVPGVAGTIGFDDPAPITVDGVDTTLGLARRASVENALATLGSMFDHDATITVRVRNDFTNDNVLAAAFGYFTPSASRVVGFDNPTIPEKKILDGVDLNSTGVDAQFDVNWKFNYDLDHNVGPGEEDLLATVVHEVVHSLGFSANINLAGTPVYGSQTVNGVVRGRWGTYDQFVSNKDGDFVIGQPGEATEFQMDTTLFNSIKTGSGQPQGGLFWNGPNGVAANGGNPIRLFSPFTNDNGDFLGSSVSHVDDNAPDIDFTTHLMVANGVTGSQNARILHPVEFGIMRDLGYTMIEPGLVITETGGSTRVSENGGTDTILVSLKTRPMEDVTVTFDDAGGDLFTGGASMTFTNQNWNIPRPITLRAAFDSDEPGDEETVTLNLTVNGSNAGDGYNTGAGSINVVVVDEVPFVDAVVSFDQATYTIGETLQIQVTDADVAGSGTADVTVFVLNGDTQNLTLTEESPGVFVGTLPTTATNTNAHDGTLTVALGDTVTAQYLDVASNGVPTFVEVTASIPANAAPVVANLGGTFTWVENGPPVLVSSGITVTDDTPNFAGGFIQIAIDKPFDSDRFIVRNQGTGAGQIGVNGTNVTFAGTVIGVLSGGANKNPLRVDLNASATPAAVQALLRNVQFFNVADQDIAGIFTTLITVNDGAGGETVVQKDGRISERNDAVVIGAFDPNVTYTENGTGILVDSNATLADPDATNFNGGNLTVALTANAAATDRLFIRNQGTGAGQIGVSESNVTFAGATIGTFAGGTGATPLVVTFNSAAASITAVRNLLRNVLFNNTSDDPGTAVRTVQATVTEGGTTSIAVSKSINVAAVKDAPVIGAFDTTVTYTENGTGNLIDSNATVKDLDTPNFNGGRLNVALTANGQATDRLAIRNQGTGAGQIGVSGSNVTFAGTTIGTFAGGVGTAALVVTFNNASTPAAAQALLRNVTFSNVSDNPPTAPRTVRAALLAIDGQNSNQPTKTINVVAVKDAPVIGAFDTTVTYTENGTGILIDSNATTADVDSPNINGGQLVVSLAANGQATDRLTIRNVGTGAGQIGVNGVNVTLGGTVIGVLSGGVGFAPLVVAFNAAATPGAAQSVLRNVLFSNTSDNPSTLDRTVRARLLVDGQNSNQPTKTIKITARNDAPVIAGFNDASSYAAGAAATLLDANATVADADSANLDTGTLSLQVVAGGVATNRLSVLNQGTGTGQIGVSGSNVTFSGVTIGAITSNGSGLTPLVVTFNANATPAAAQALVRRLSFFSTVGNPTGPKTLRLTLRDGDGGMATVDKPLNITSNSASSSASSAAAFAAYGDWERDLSV